MKTLFVALALIASPAFAKVTFVNLDKDSMRIARYEYTDGSKPGYPEQGWIFYGWTVLEAGEYMRSDSNHFYVENRTNDRQMVWNGLEKSTGFVKSGPFTGYWPKGSDPQRRLIDKGFKRVEFQTFQDKTYTIGGGAYRIASKDISFSFESRSIKFLNESFKVAGKVLDYQVHASSSGARDINWKRVGNGDSVGFSGSIEGRQPYPGAPRDKGYYSGYVHVDYVAPR